MKVRWLSVACAALLFLVVCSGHNAMFARKATRFDWLTTESAPRKYPMKILKGTLYYHGEKGGLYIPDAASIAPGWGTGVSHHVVGEDLKALPDRLDIRFFSFAEQKRYHGSFD